MISSHCILTYSYIYTIYSVCVDKKLDILTYVCLTDKFQTFVINFFLHMKEQNHGGTPITTLYEKVLVYTNFFDV